MNLIATGAATFAVVGAVAAFAMQPSLGSAPPAPVEGRAVSMTAVGPDGAVGPDDANLGVRADIEARLSHYMDRDVSVVDAVRTSGSQLVTYCGTFTSRAEDGVLETAAFSWAVWSHADDEVAVSEGPADCGEGAEVVRNGRVIAWEVAQRPFAAPAPSNAVGMAAAAAPLPVSRRDGERYAAQVLSDRSVREYLAAQEINRRVQNGEQIDLRMIDWQ